MFEKSPIKHTRTFYLSPTYGNSWDGDALDFYIIIVGYERLSTVFRFNEFV